MRGVSRNQLPTPGPLLPEAHESLISSKTIAAVPLNGRSVSPPQISLAVLRQMPLGAAVAAWLAFDETALVNLKWR